MKTFPFEHGQYIRVAEFTLDSVLPYVVDYKTLMKSGVKKGSEEYYRLVERWYGGYRVKMDSQRYQLFALRGVRCVDCGLEGEFFGLEKIIGEGSERYHFNLYGVRDGEEILITKDHIIPKSKGGKNTLDNYQVMCHYCNKEKSDIIR